MPGNPFRKAHRGGNTNAKVRSPQKGKSTVSFVPTPKSPIGNVSRPVAASRRPSTRVTTKGRHSVNPPSVRQGAQMGTPGRRGS